MCHAICTYKIPLMKRSPSHSQLFSIHTLSLYFSLSLTHTHNYLLCTHGMFAEALQEKQNEMKYMSRNKKLKLNLQNYRA